MVKCNCQKKRTEQYNVQSASLACKHMSNPWVDQPVDLKIGCGSCGETATEAKTCFSENNGFPHSAYVTTT